MEQIYYNLCKEHSLLKTYFLIPCERKIYDNNIDFIKDKFKIMKKLLIKYNTFNLHDKNELFSNFITCQRAIFGLYTLKRIIRNKRSSYNNCDVDLNYNKLCDFRESKKINIIENQVIYTFTLQNLVNIINNSLAFHDDFFSEPSVIKNPYTNLKISYGALVNINEAFKRSSYKTPILFERFFGCFFNIKTFELENDVLIREHNIKQFMISGSKEDKLKYINDMILFFNKKQKKLKKGKILIDTDYPKDMLLSTFHKFYLF